ncbi:unnamed protein product [Plutella xylostella]|uniref:(diamondback moth) hypothetical protein n=1 Tax=Plutella xylostella TaxID=51655 RepID=A0A8S4D6M6_PLUXY|nr:unnamed protein product [Plutella xylostella]
MNGYCRCRTYRVTLQGRQMRALSSPAFLHHPNLNGISLLSLTPSTEPSRTENCNYRCCICEDACTPRAEAAPLSAGAERSVERSGERGGERGGERACACAAWSPRRQPAPHEILRPKPRRNPVSNRSIFKPFCAEQHHASKTPSPAICSSPIHSTVHLTLVVNIKLFNGPSQRCHSTAAIIHYFINIVVWSGSSGSCEVFDPLARRAMHHADRAGVDVEGIIDAYCWLPLLAVIDDVL